MEDSSKGKSRRQTRRGKGRSRRFMTPTLGGKTNSIRSSWPSVPLRLPCARGPGPSSFSFPRRCARTRFASASPLRGGCHRQSSISTLQSASSGRPVRSANRPKQCCRRCPEGRCRRDEGCLLVWSRDDSLLRHRECQVNNATVRARTLAPTLIISELEAQATQRFHSRTRRSERIHPYRSVARALRLATGAAGRGAVRPPPDVRPSCLKLSDEFDKAVNPIGASRCVH